MTKKNEFLISAKFFFDNGEVKTIHWVEDSLFKDGEGGTKVSLNKDEVKLEFRKLFLSYLVNGKIFTVENTLDKISVVPMNKVTYVEVDVKDSSEENSTNQNGGQVDGR